jgi:amidohydrolase
MDYELGKRILGKAYDLGNQVKTWRRYFHEYPELGFQEFRTAEHIFSVLKQLGLRVQKGIGGTGVVGVLENGGGKTIALKADMDALPIFEETNLPYHSKNNGVMHACGHDAHMAILLGAATLLVEMKDVFEGTVKFIFQPAEEVENGGAPRLIREGVLVQPNVDAIIGLHLFNHFPSGTVGLTRGTVTAAVDNFEIEIVGKSGHGARPHETVDSVLIAAQIIFSIQTIVSRETDALEPKVITIGEINGGTAPNVIAERTRLKGTIRSLSESMRAKAAQLLMERCESVARSMGGKATVNVRKLLPPQVNHSGLYEVVRSAALACLTPEKIIDYDRPSMGGEDFSFYSQLVPGVYYRLGIYDEEKGFVSPLHSSNFDFDESVLPIGVATMAASAVEAQHLDWKK